ncbi:hypothetical protein Emag_002483 [Eimeria magna]
MGSSEQPAAAVSCCSLLLPSAAAVCCCGLPLYRHSRRLGRQPEGLEEETGQQLRPLVLSSHVLEAQVREKRKLIDASPPFEAFEDYEETGDTETPHHAMRPSRCSSSSSSRRWKQQQQQQQQQAMEAAAAAAGDGAAAAAAAAAGVSERKRD